PSAAMTRTLSGGSGAAWAADAVNRLPVTMIAEAARVARARRPQDEVRIWRYSVRRCGWSVRGAQPRPDGAGGSGVIGPPGTILRERYTRVSRRGNGCRVTRAVRPLGG